ncbi:MAG: 2-C-methyl-D-erythritol 4-phosphate cytidylyltransferase [Victivallales bacterium]|jgi:2-C-methyl-D-erythritol 4-phosphate cytidylyltransferase|nr:2-C-methyl-D-erythritol 4-phosphate cytidylyltransferase [Victivallales bacterium]
MIPDLSIVIVAGGSGRRFGGDKLLFELDGLPVFLHSVKRFLPLAVPGKLTVVYPKGRGEEFTKCAEHFLPGEKIVWVEGGAIRTDSVRNGLEAIEPKTGIVAIHDAARPLASVDLLERLVAETRRCGGAIPGKIVTDTLKRCKESNLIEETVSRTGLWRVETPQVFHLAQLYRAYRQNPGADFSDDAGIYTYAGFTCAVLDNPDDNTKITYFNDIAKVEKQLRELRK